MVGILSGTLVWNRDRYCPFVVYGRYKYAFRSLFKCGDDILDARLAAGLGSDARVDVSCNLCSLDFDCPVGDTRCVTLVDSSRRTLDRIEVI